MQMDPRIILAGQAPDVIGSMGRGMQLRQQERDNQHVNSLRDMLQQYGPGIASGEQNALAQLARFDPSASLGIQQTRQSMDVQRQQLDLARQAAARAASTHAAQMDEVTRQREAAVLQRGIAMLTQAQTPEAFAQVMQMPGVAQAAESMFGQGMATFENRNLLIAGALGVSDALAMGRPSGTPTSAQREYEQAVAQGYEGTLMDYQIAMRQAGRAQNNISIGGEQAGARVGTLPQGYSAVQDPNDPSGYRMFPIPGGPEDTSAADQRRAGRAAVTGDIITTAADTILGLTDAGAGGLSSWAASYLPTTEGADLYRQVDVLRAQARFGNLQAMREASPTGGALGAVSDAEGRALEAASGALDPRSPTFQRDVLNFTRQLLRTIHGPQEGEALFSDLYGERAAQAGIRVSGGEPQPSARAAPSQQAPAQGSVPDQAVRMLLDDPSPEAQREFDAVFGPGAAQQVLGAIR